MLRRSRQIVECFRRAPAVPFLDSAARRRIFCAELCAHVSGLWGSAKFQRIGPLGWATRESAASCCTEPRSAVKPAGVQPFMWAGSWRDQSAFLPSRSISNVPTDSASSSNAVQVPSGAEVRNPKIRCAQAPRTKSSSTHFHVG